MSRTLPLPAIITFLLSWMVLLWLPGGGTLLINFLYFYFAAGYLLHHYQARLQPYRAMLWMASVAGFAFAIYGGWAVPCEKVDGAWLLAQPQRVGIQLFVGLVGALTVIGFCACLEQVAQRYAAWQRAYTWCSRVGMQTLGIYVVQTFLIEHGVAMWGKWRGSIEMPVVVDFVVIPIIGGCLCVVSYYGVCFARKSKMINLLFFGGTK